MMALLLSNRCTCPLEAPHPRGDGSFAVSAGFQRRALASWRHPQRPTEKAGVSCEATQVCGELCTADRRWNKLERYFKHDRHPDVHG